MPFQGFIIRIYFNKKYIGMGAYNTLYRRLQAVLKHQILLIIADIFRIQALDDLGIIQQTGYDRLALGDLAVQHGIGLPDLFLHTLLLLIQ